MEDVYAVTPHTVPATRYRLGMTQAVLDYQPRYQAYLNAGEPGGIFSLWNSERWGEFLRELRGRVPKRGSAEGDYLWNYLVWKHGDEYNAWLSKHFPAPEQSAVS